MLDESTLRLIDETAAELNLKQVTIEKDYYVTQILNVLANLQDDYSVLVFGGGTALAKAHRLIKRMSEDVDFKFQKKPGYEELSKNQYLKTLKSYRERIISALKEMNDLKSEVVVRNAGKYVRIYMEYESAFAPGLQLRPHVLLEFTASELRLPMHVLPVRTLMEETFEINTPNPPAQLMCISEEETAAEKWVSVTRRIAGIDRGYLKNDSTLVRHIYDLASIRSEKNLNSNFFSVIQETISQDAKQFKNLYPEYLDNPLTEIQHSLSILKNNPEWEGHYNKFITEMVYDTTTNRSFKEAFSVLEKLSNEIIKALSWENINN